MRLSRFRTRAAQPKAGHAQSPRRCQPRHAGHAPPGTAGRAGQGLLRRRAMQAMVGKHGGQSRPGRRISLAASWPRPGRVLVSPGEPPQHKYDKPFFSRCPTPLKQGRPWNWWFGPPETNLTPHTSLVPALRVPRAVPRTIGGRWSLASSLSRTCATTRGGGLPIYGLDAAGEPVSPRPGTSNAPAGLCTACGRQQGDTWRSWLSHGGSIRAVGAARDGLAAKGGGGNDGRVACGAGWNALIRDFRPGIWAENHARYS
jgi:hypothetical protein